MHQADFSTARNVYNQIELFLGESAYIKIEDPRTVSVDLPQDYPGGIMGLRADLEQLDIEMDRVAKIILNERTGTVVIGAGVRLRPAAVAHGSLTVVVKDNIAVSQPNAFSDGETVVAQTQEADIEEKNEKLILLKSAPTVGELVRSLNRLEVTPRDVMAILQALKKVGSLTAIIEVI